MVPAGQASYRSVGHDYHDVPPSSSSIARVKHQFFPSASISSDDADYSYDNGSQSPSRGMHQESWPEEIFNAGGDEEMGRNRNNSRKPVDSRREIRHRRHDKVCPNIC